MTSPPRVDSPGSSGVGGIDAPWTEWSAVAQFVNKNWDSKNNPHHSIIGLTGSGKTFLIGNGILKPMCSMDRVILFDSKGGSDESLTDLPANECKTLPKKTWGGTALGRKREPFDSWHRVVLDRDIRKARGQVAETLERVWQEGNYVLCFDELTHITGRQNPDLGMYGPVNQMYRMGRSKGIPIIAGTQSPVDVPRTFYDQASFAWVGRIRDRDRQKRLTEIGGLARQDIGYIETLKSREWLLCASNGEQFFRTTVKV